MALFNINGTVSVKLTPAGRRILREQHDDLSKEIKTRHGYIPPKEDENGWSEWQLWDLMLRFGPHIHLSGEPPFETTIDVRVSGIKSRMDERKRCVSVAEKWLSFWSQHSGGQNDPAHDSRAGGVTYGRIQAAETIKTHMAELSF